MNTCMFVGNFAKDATIHNGERAKVAKTTLAVGERFKGKDGQYVERTEWVNLVAFGHVADVIEKNCHKGVKAFVVGKFQTRKWQGQDGKNNYTTEIIVDRIEIIKYSDKGAASAPAEDGGNFNQDDLPF